MNLHESLAVFGIIPQRDIDPLVQAKAQAHGGVMTQELLNEVRDEVLDRIKQEFRRRAKELHPDTGGDMEEMQKLNEAMSVAKGLQLSGRAPAPPPRVVIIYGNPFGNFPDTTTNTSSFFSW